MHLRRILAMTFLFVLLSPFLAAADPTASGAGLGTLLPLWSVIPFVGILLSIALFPLFAPTFWHHHFGKVSLFWALVLAGPFVAVYGTTALREIVHVFVIDYIPFIILLWSLFTVSGGILLRGSLNGKPLTNTILLLIGTLLASLIGTTGAAMLLIRPVLRSIKERKYKVHTVVFFIFLVANIGGSLTPLGDPPLFLGFLHGVSFFWTLHLLPHMGLASLILLVLYFAMDSYYHHKEGAAPVAEKGARLQILGWHNGFLLLGIVMGVLLSGLLHLGETTLFGIHLSLANLSRDVLLLGIGWLSLKTTRREIRREQEFSWGPIQEVAILFAGIFVTIIPALDILKAGANGSLAFLIRAVQQPHHYFWAAGSLSSFLDNAPTYLTFFNTAIGQFFAGMPEKAAAIGLMGDKTIFLQAISAGAVFMGANTYIGNAPNFMVKAIAGEFGVEMPSFFGYIFKYSLPILIPIFILITIVFF